MPTVRPLPFGAAAYTRDEAGAPAKVCETLAMRDWAGAQCKILPFFIRFNDNRLACLCKKAFLSISIFVPIRWRRKGFAIYIVM